MQFTCQVSNSGLAAREGRFIVVHPAAVSNMLESAVRPRPLQIVMLPSVSGGIGHVSRCGALARALRRLDSTIDIEFVLDMDRLRWFNVEATERMGFRPRLMPVRTRENRNAVVRSSLGEPDLVVDDVSRHLLPYRSMIPQSGWVTIAMHPIGDELFHDWPHMAQMDAVFWPYIPLIGIPAELEIVKDKVIPTGPFLETDDVPDKAAAKASLGIAPTEKTVVFAPRGFPFGREFGHRVLGSIYGAVERIRQTVDATLTLTLIAVTNPADLQGVPGVPSTLPDWVRVRGVVSAAESLAFTRSAELVIAEGTSTMHEAAALRTPLLMVPGPIQETWLLGTRLGEQKAAHLVWIEAVTADRFTSVIESVMTDRDATQAMTQRAYSLVTGGGGVKAAAAAVLELATSRRRAALARSRA
ncbi:MAG: hypothetical protein JWQ11_2984 [Rhizobacter sp.]|nr:hypothetical protein [Rhizobacter sp.]